MYTRNAITLCSTLLLSLSAVAQSAPASAAAPTPAPTAATTSAPGGDVTASASAPAPVNPADNLPAFEQGMFFLFDGEKFVRMEKTPFAVVGRAAFITMLIFLKIPGAAADSRVKSGAKPFILIGGSTKGGQLVHFGVETARKDPHRETRMVGEGVITSSDLVHFQDEKLPSGWHKIIPNINRSGEYGWVPFVGTHEQYIYDYGIDAAPVSAK